MVLLNSRKSISSEILACKERTVVHVLASSSSRHDTQHNLVEHYDDACNALGFAQAVCCVSIEMRALGKYRLIQISEARVNLLFYDSLSEISAKRNPLCTRLYRTVRSCENLACRDLCLSQRWSCAWSK